MQPNSSVRRVGPSILIGGTAGIAAYILTRAIAGTIFVQGNIVGVPEKNPNAGLILGTRAILTPAVDTACYSGCNRTASGGVAKYDTLLISSPFNSTASTRGLKTGTGVVRYLQLDIIRNPLGSPIDCSVVSATKTGTGGTALITGATATGSVTTYTTAFTVGPTEYIKCGTGTTPTTGTGTVSNTGSKSFSATLRAIFGDSDVVD